MKTMKRFTLSIICALLFASFSWAQDVSSVKIQKETFLKVLSPTEISSAIVDINDEVFFININDMYIGETNAIPQNSRFYGHIEDIKEPVQGTNAAIKIKIDKLVLPNKKIIPVDAYIYSENNNFLGGDQTPPMYYNRMPHYTKGWNSGILQYTPTNIRHPGQPTIILPGAELFIILIDDLIIN